MGSLRHHRQPQPDLPELAMTTVETFRDGKRGAVAALAVLLALAFVSPSLAAPEDSITPLEQYNTPKAKALASTYKPQLLRFYEHVYWCLPWLGVAKNGIGFRQPKGITADDRYLSVWVMIDQTDDGSFAAMPRERRVSAMFSRYGVDLLRRLTAMTSAASVTTSSARISAGTAFSSMSCSAIT